MLDGLVEAFLDKFPLKPCCGFAARKRYRNSAPFHAQVHSHFNQERYLVTREVLQYRDARPG
jgi:hypothetical protein